MRPPLAPDTLLGPPHVYVVPALVDDWHDGDTMRCHRGVSPGVVLHGDPVRVQGMNAPELATSAGKLSLAHARLLAPTGTRVLLTATRQDKYGRFLARVTLPDGSDFGDRMIADGFAVPFMVP